MVNPESVVYSIGKTSAGNPYVVITTQTIDWDGKPIGAPSKTTVTIQEIEQHIGFCIRCGNDALLQAVKGAVSR